MKNWLDKYEYGGQAGYTDVPFNYNSAWGGQFQDGGKLTEEQLDSLNKAKMKAKMALAAEFGNPSAKRMTSISPSTYTFIGDETIHGNPIGVPAGEVGTHFMGSMGSYAVPYIQEGPSGSLQFNSNASPRDREAIRFDNPQDAEYFAEHYKEVAPMMQSFAMGGSLPGAVGFTYARTGSIPSNGKYAKKTKASAQTGETVSQDTAAYQTLPEVVVNSTIDPEVEQARQSMFDFYSNRPANLSGDIASEAVQNVKIEEIPLKRLQKLNAYGLYFPKTNTIGYNNETITPEGYSESPYDELKTIQHEIGHSVFESLPENEQQIIEESIISPKEFRNRWNKGEISRGWSKYVTKPTEFYTRRNKMFDIFEIDESQPITDDKAQEMIDFRRFMSSTASPEEKEELLKKHPNLNKYKQNFETSPIKGEIIDFMNSIKNNVPTYKRVFNEVTAVPGEQVPVAQNGMTYYQHGLDWKPKTISKNGSDIPKNQNAKYTLPNARDLARQMVGSNESTSLGTKIDEAALRQASIDRQRRNQGSIRQAGPERSAASKAWAIATHPMTALTYKVKGQDIPENFEKGERNALDYAMDVINPASYLGAVGRTADNITSPKKMFYRALNSIEGDDNMLDVVGDALVTTSIPGLAKSTLSTLDKQFSNVGRQLEKIRFEGEAKGLNPHEIADLQMKKVGITSNQRQAYLPGVSELINKYVTPVGYQGHFENTKLSQILDNIKKGGHNIAEKYPNRQDAWNLYLGMPQTNKTFRLSNTSPALHPLYKPGSLKGMDIYNLRYMDDYYVWPDYETGNYLKKLERPVTFDREGAYGVMGGYNRRITKQGTQYNDIWDLEPTISLRSFFPRKISDNPALENIFYKKKIVSGVETGVPRAIKVPVDKFIGKPFMSHGNTPYTSYDYLKEVERQISEQIKELEPMRNTAIRGEERLRKLQQDLEYIKNYKPKYEEGGVIKDDNGYWNPDNWGKVVEIDSPDITMQGVDQPLLGISDTGDVQYMEPGKEYKFKGKKVTEYPMAQKGRKVAPVYVNDPNDPRLKLYTDSLSTYNKSLNPWHWPGTKVTTKQDYEKKLKLQRDFPHWSFDEDQYKKDKKKGKFKDFNDYVYDVGMADKGDPKALDAFNRNTGKHFKDFEEPIEKKLPDGRIKQYWGTYKGKLDESNYTIYDPVTGSSSYYTHSGNGPDTFLGIYNPNIKPIGHIYHAFDQPYNTGEIYISSEDSEYVNKVLKNKTNKKKNYINYTYGANDNEVYKEPVQPVIYDKKKYNPNDPRLKQLQESFDKFHSNIGKKSKEQHKKSEPKPEEPTLKKKVSKMEPIRSSYTPSLSLRTIQTPNIELPGIQMGDYEVSYYSPESKDWANRRFTSQEESDKFAQEMSQRGYFGSYGNVTQTKKINKKSTGGWLDKYN